MRINLTDLTHPVFLSGIDTPCSAQDIEIVGTKAYVADGEGGVAVLELIRNQKPVPLIHIAPLASISTEEEQLVISPNNREATVLLDGSESSDPDGDPLTFTWLEEPELTPLGHEAETILIAEVGQHTVTLVVDDGQYTAVASATFEVITAGQAVERLIWEVEDSPLDQNGKRPLIATLNASVATFGRGRFNAGINQLNAFQNKVRAQVTRIDAKLAEDLIGVTQEIIDALAE